MKARLLFQISLFLLVIFAFQNCTQSGQPVFFDKIISSSNSFEAQGGNGGGYEGKLTFLEVKAGFTCENKQAPKSILRRDENKIWYLTVNEKTQCGKVRGLILTDVTYMTGSHRLTYNGIEYILDPEAPWDLNSVLVDYLREFKVAPSADNNSKDWRPGDGICADLNGQCTLQAAVDEANSRPNLGAIILVSAGQYILSQEVAVLSKAFTWIKGDSRDTTILNGGRQTRILSSDNATLKLSDLTLTEARVEGNSNIGGGIYSRSSHLFLYDLSFKNNFATYQGAGALSLLGNLYIRRTIFDSNLLGPERGLIFGEAVHSYKNFEVIIEDCEFLNHNNKTSERGVIYSFGDSYFTIRKSLLYSNKIPGPALALIGTLEKIWIENLTAAENGGRGLYVYNRLNDPVRETTIQNSTFFNNTRAYEVPGHEVDFNWQNAPNASNLLQVLNSAFGKASSAESCTPLWVVAPLPEATRLVLKGNVDASQGCAGILDPAAKIVSSLQISPALTYNGGFVRNLMPLPASPLVDAGDNPSCSATDQRGSKRPKDFLGAGAICDVGAIEL